MDRPSQPWYTYPGRFLSKSILGKTFEGMPPSLNTAMIDRGDHHDEADIFLDTIGRVRQDLFEGDGSLLAELISKSADSPAEGASNVGAADGRKEHPFNMEVVHEYRDFNVHHAACIEAKRATTVGFGHRDDRIADALDFVSGTGPDEGWQTVLDKFVEDYWEHGNGYLEIVRGEEDNPNLITGIHHVPAEEAWVIVEDARGRDRHYELLSDSGIMTANRFARFGDLVDLRRRMQTIGSNTITGATAIPAAITSSEIIHWRFPSSRSRYYGYPEYFSAVPKIELEKCLTQHSFDFYFNRGVPEFLLFILGKALSKAAWEEVKKTIRANQGLGNSFKSGAFNIAGKDVKVQVEKLGLDEANADGFVEKAESLASLIVSAHGVPHQVANIVISSRMRAANEGVQALTMFQLLKIGPTQKALSRLLACTLGAKGQVIRQESGSDLALPREAFLGTETEESKKGNGFLTVLDQVDLQMFDTTARMQDDAMTSGRDPADGLARNGQDRGRMARRGRAGADRPTAG